MRRLLVIACALLLMPGETLAGEASTPPRREGPWKPSGSDMPVSSAMFEPCSTEILTWTDDSPAVEVESCDWWFQYAEGAESNAAKDYGILWLQTTAMPYKGFCIERSKARFGADSQFEVMNGVKARSIRASGTVRENVGLTTEAGGYGTLPASVTKELRIHTGRMTIGPVMGDGSIGSKWRSSQPSEKPISLVLGIEVAWDSDLTTFLTAVYEIRTETRTTYTRC